MPPDRKHLSACPPAPQSAGTPDPSGRYAGGCLLQSQGGSAAGAKQRHWTSQQLLGNQAEAEITHAGTRYRLRLTALGKLILTK